MFNKYQKTTAAVYGGGDFAHVETMEEVEQCGDTLFQFLMIELSDSESCESVSEAGSRLETAISQIRECLEAVERSV